MIKQSASGQKIFELKEKYKKIWQNTPDTLPAFRACYTAGQRRNKEARMDSLTDRILKLVRDFSVKSTEDSVRWGSELKRLVYDCGADILELEGGSMRMLLEDGFCDVTSGFISKAREFDAGFKLEDIFQSLRNTWIMNCIQKLMGMKVELTPSIFAYSMLYPYTDNYLDAPSVLEKEKMQTNQNFRRRLAGADIRALSLLEERLFRLVRMIEGQYSRSSFPMVYESLLGIQTAQEKSLLQSAYSGEACPDILDISVEKGGCSVLADGCLVRGGLSDQEASFIFGFGVMLQFIDDLQDAYDDRDKGHNTIFSGRNTKASAESMTNRLINFVAGILDDDRCFCSREAMELKRLIRDSVLFLVMGAVACNSDMYGRDWLRSLEEHSPLSFKYLKSFYKRIEREFRKLKIKLAVRPLEIPMARAFASGILS